MLLPSEERLVRARAALERRGTAPADLLEPEIAASWTRCLQAGLDPGQPPPLTVVDEATLDRAREAREMLRRLAIAEMQNLFHQISGSNFMIAFAAPDGLLLDTIADSSFGATARATAIRPGTLWTEARCGTNALGTVAATGQPLSVHAGEHFFARYGALTCTAAPVFDPAGALAGVLDASSDCRSRQQHTRALVSMAASQIENGLLREAHRRDLLIAFHSRGEYLHTLSAGLLAVDPGGTVLAANRQARFLLQGLPAGAGQAFHDCFRTRFADFLEEGMDHERQRLEDRVGSIFVARIENLRRARPVVVRVPPPAALPTGFVAEDPAVAASARQVAAAAARRLPILIRGQTGTGKEQLARHAHEASRRTGAFVPVNCAALPDSLIEAELFGHADGAFTGARRGGAPGLVAEADGGTLVLDEIGDLPLALQAVLLRLLDDWTLRPVGGGRRRTVDVLLLAATNADLARAVAEGRFRADLLYRLNTVEVTLPPLARRQDFAAIARHLLAGIAPGWRITDGAVARLAAAPWPGNMRELRSVLTRLTLAEDGGTIGEASVAALGPGALPVVPDAPAADPPFAGLRQSLRDQVRSAFQTTGGNVSETARRLRVSRNTVYRALGHAARTVE
jgi:transcriptional regulator of acetoin/glycerol metabolism